MDLIFNTIVGSLVVDQLDVFNGFVGPILWITSPPNTDSE